MKYLYYYLQHHLSSFLMRLNFLPLRTYISLVERRAFSRESMDAIVRKEMLAIDQEILGSRSRRKR